MTDFDTLTEDLGYVRRALRERDRAPASVLFLWTALGAPGFAIADVAPHLLGWYWGVAGPAGFIASALLGYRASRNAGRRDRRGGMRWALHFGGALLGIVALVALGVAGAVPWIAVQLGILALLGVAYLLAGIHLDPRLYWVAAAFAASIPVALLVRPWGWTAAGALVAAALILAALLTRDRGVAGAP